MSQREKRYTAEEAIRKLWGINTNDIDPQLSSDDNVDDLEEADSTVTILLPEISDKEFNDDTSDSDNVACFTSVSNQTNPIVNKSDLTSPDGFVWKIIDASSVSQSALAAAHSVVH